MLTTFQHLSPSELSRLAQLVQKIVQAINPDKIICYGSRITTMQDWSPFMERDGYKETIHPTYDFLLSTNNDEKRADHEIIQAIEQVTTPTGCAATIIVQQLASVNEALEKGARFVTAVYSKGVLVYNGTGLPLAIPQVELDMSIIRNKVEAYWDKCFSQAQRFFKTASYCFENEWYEQATFDLHQSVQHTCMALLRAFTGHRSTTHNLSRLLELIGNFSYEPIVVFPCITKEETDLFNLLNRAYSEARYNEQYVVPAGKATILIERVKQLLAIAEQLYQERLLTLQNDQPVSFPLISTHAQA